MSSQEYIGSCSWFVLLVLSSFFLDRFPNSCHFDSSITLTGFRDSFLCNTHCIVPPPLSLTRPVTPQQVLQGALPRLPRAEPLWMVRAASVLSAPRAAPPHWAAGKSPTPAALARTQTRARPSARQALPSRIAVGVVQVALPHSTGSPPLCSTQD